MRDERLSPAGRYTDATGRPVPKPPEIEPLPAPPPRHRVVTLEPGLERTDEFVAEGPLLTDVGGTLPVSVLSTPGMIGVMERCAADAGLRAAGRRAAPPWASRSASSTWPPPARARTARSPPGSREIVDERKLRFDVEVREGDRTLGVGTHERRIVQQTGFGG